MSIRVCTSEYMLSTVRGMDMSRSWFPRVVAEVMLESTKDGEIKRSPDPVTMIDGDLTFYNNSADSQHVVVQLTRGPRTIVAQNPSTVVIHDAVSKAVGYNSPTADYPTIIANASGGKVQFNRQETAAEDLYYGRFFLEVDSTQTWIEVGEVKPQQSMHFRYLAAVQTPGVWTAPSEFEARWEAFARWARLTAFATPLGTA